VEQAGPFLLAVPACGQVEREVAAAVAGSPRGDIDEVAAQGGAAGLGVAAPGQGPGGAQQVAADRGERQPGRVGGERARRQVRERPVGPVGEDLLGPGVAAMVFFGLDDLEWGVGEDGVVAPGGEQLALAPGAEVADPADDQPGGDGLPLA
jgi:hypothetical protein